ncbi:uncharacterized protein [Pocillopora verrucosa]|uniref:uncharacterized protein n=1 Tax=Pocillopora verrucosa TaxID=203993 RepID=UPI0027970BFE|nr:uncharacterized protein LOC131773576 [Pocillopora verrucosa]
MLIALAIITAVLVNMSPTCSSCPSPAVTYAAETDNVTLCWQIPADIDIKRLTRFTVLALKRPVQLVMEKVASAGDSGKFFRTYDDYHDGLYSGRATMDADLSGRMVFFRITNYSTAMENVYCILYEMFVLNDVLMCHSHAIFLRTVVPVQIQNCTPNLTLTASQAQPVTLTCSVTGKPQPRVAWYSLPDMVLLKSSITSHSALVITKSAVEIRVKRGLRQYLFETVNHPNGKKRTRVLTVYGKYDEIPSTAANNVTVAGMTSATLLTTKPTQGQPEKLSDTNLRTGLIVVSAIFGLFLVGVVFLVLRYRRTQRNKSLGNKRVRRNDTEKSATPLTSCEAT